MYTYVFNSRCARLLWPATMLMLLLQRTPVLRVLVSSEFAIGVRAGQMLRAAFPLLAGAVVVNTVTGATQFSTNPSSPASATVGTAVAMVFSVTGAPSVPKSYTVSGLPPGLTVTSATLSGSTWTVNASTGSITGTPTTAGNYAVSIRAWAKVNASGDKGPIYPYTFNVTGVVTSPPSFSVQPNAQTVTAGANVSLTVAASGTPAPTFQWRRGGASLSGQTTATLALTAVAVSDAGSYDCVATNSAGSTTSQAVTLTVNAAPAAPAFTTQPVAQSVTAGGSAALAVAASGNPTPTLQWRKGGVNLAGQTAATLSFAYVTPGDAGTYSCVATNTVGATTSAAVTLTVAAAAPPAIAGQPAAMTSLAGSGAFFSVQATGVGLAYQWRRDGTAITGATQSSLYLANVQPGSAGAYSVLITDSFGAQVASSAASLAVAASGSSRLVNLSARAGVGVGAGALIPGFSITGDVALTLLVRGVGPHLATFQVPGVLADPVMTLFQGANVIATNDDWEQNANLGALNAATGSEGAFPLAAGSKDCAMLLTLNPGVYTVQITGKDGATGEALVEFYVVEPDPVLTGL